MVPFSFAGETFVASPEGAVHWPAQKALLVADLHLEKASWFARLGQFLPPYNSVATLSALQTVVEATGVETLYCLGDSFHDRFGCDRLPDQARSLLQDMTARLDWVWILGNHDPGFADHCGGRLIEETEVSGNHPPSRSRPRRPAARNIGPLPPEISRQRPWPPSLAALPGRLLDQADHAGLRLANRRPGRFASGDREASGALGIGAGAPARSNAEIPACGLTDLDKCERHKAGV